MKLQGLAYASVAIFMAGCSHPAAPPKVSVADLPKPDTSSMITLTSKAHRAKLPKPKLVAADISTLKGALQHFQLDCGRYPTTAEGLRPLIVAPGDVQAKWKGPYLLTIPLDPWGNPYHYTAGKPGAQPFTISSYGADGKPGGTGNGADISS